MSKLRKAFVLVSGGLDSTTLLHRASTEFVECEGVSVDYGQRHMKEMEYAKAQCAAVGASHHLLRAGDILRGSMLTDKSIPIPDVRYEDIEGVSPTYVPFRNGTLLSLITSHAQRWIDRGLALGAECEAMIYFGAHAEDAQNWAYPDCTPEFIGAMANAIYIGTYQRVRLCTPYMWYAKWEIVGEGDSLGVDYSKTWSCYAGDDLHCGKCPTCYARQDAFARANVIDPTEYAVQRKTA